jgi:hypothetical protein
MGTYRALGYTFDVSVEPSTPLSTAAAVPWVLSHLNHDVKPQHHFVFSRRTKGSDLTVEVDGVALGEHSRLADGLDVLVAEVNRQAVMSRRDKLGLHAAAVSWRGQGILLVGPSKAGKSTLAAALVRDGSGYLTDEAAFVDLNTLIIEPYPKPLSLRTGSLALLGLRTPEEVQGTTSDLVPASYLRSSVEIATVPLSTIVFIRRRPGEAVSYRPIPRAEALVELTNNSFNFVDHGGSWLGRLRRLVLACSCWHLESGDIHAAAQAVIHIAEVRAGRQTV